MRRTVSIIALLILLAGAAWFLLRSHRPGSTVPPKTVPPGVRISDSSPARAPAAPTAAQVKPKEDWPGSHIPPAPTPDQASSSATREEPSEAVQVAVTGQDYRQRLAAIKSLGNRLPAVDVNCMMTYLADTATAREGNLWDLGLKNEALTVLLRQERVPTGMGNLLSDIVRNETIDLTWRDYALQFVPVYAARTVGRPEPENVAIRSTVAAAMTSTGTCMRGTALIAMQRLGVETNLFTRQELKEASRTILREARPGDPARITAIQTLVERGDTEALDEARRIGRDTSSPVLERMSALGALGTAGEAEDLAWLRDFRRQPALDPRLQRAADFNEKQLARVIERGTGR